MANAHDVAAALLERVGPITTMKLQKLVYYAQAWQLVFHNKPMFEDAIEAWAEGPVTRALHELHRGRYQVRDWPRGDQRNLAAEELATIDWVVFTYSQFSAEALSRMTHIDNPWRVARGPLPENAKCSTAISLDQMRHFYSRHRADVDVAVAQAAASAALEGVELDDAWQQVLREVASGERSASDVIEEEIRRARRS